MAKHLQESKLNNKSYDILKWVALVALPATSALYLTLAALWHLPHPTEVAGTIAAIDTFLGVLLGVSSNKYQGTQPSGAFTCPRTRESTPPLTRASPRCSGMER